MDSDAPSRCSSPAVSCLVTSSIEQMHPDAPDLLVVWKTEYKDQPTSNPSLFARMHKGRHQACCWFSQSHDKEWCFCHPWAGEELIEGASVVMIQLPELWQEFFNLSCLFFSAQGPEAHVNEMAMEDAEVCLRRWCIYLA